MRKSNLSTKLKTLILSTILLLLSSCANMQIRDPQAFSQALNYWQSSQQPIEMPRAPSTNQHFFHIKK
jgi:outer membrane biogenesis lipoprotein LolB